MITSYESWPALQIGSAGRDRKQGLILSLCGESAGSCQIQLCLYNKNRPNKEDRIMSSSEHSFLGSLHWNPADFYLVFIVPTNRTGRIHCLPKSHTSPFEETLSERHNCWSLSNQPLEGKEEAVLNLPQPYTSPPNYHPRNTNAHARCSLEGRLCVWSIARELSMCQRCYLELSTHCSICSLSCGVCAGKMHSLVDFLSIFVGFFKSLLIFCQLHVSSRSFSGIFKYSFVTLSMETRIVFGT